MVLEKKEKIQMKAGKSSFKFIFTAMAVIFFLTGCAETEFVSHWAKKIVWPGQKESKGSYKVGNPYKVGNVWYYPEENFNLVETGIASWYGPGFHADLTANGEIFDQNELTAAHRTLQLPSLVRVTNLENGRSIVVRVNDRGPFKHGRILDVSKRAAELLGYANKGTARVKIKVLENESRILAAAAKRGEDTARMTLADINKRTAQPLPRKVFQPLYKTAQASTSDLNRTAMTEKNAHSVAEQIEYIGGNDATPESLLTPTITVDALKRPGSENFSEVSPVEKAPVVSIKKLQEDVPKEKPMVAGSLKKGLFMPSQLVSNEPVKPTGIFVQAGSFGVYSNAERLAKDMVNISPTVIEPFTVNGQKLYRVKLGPIDSIEEADGVLERVIQAGQNTAWLIKNKK